MTSYGTYARQHRRQESAGIATADRHRIYMHAETGLVSRVFDKAWELLTDTIAVYRKSRRRDSRTSSPVLSPQETREILAQTAYSVAAPSRGRVMAHPALGGLLHEYEWEAA